MLTADPEIPVPPTHYGGIERVINELASYFVDAGMELGLVSHPDSQVSSVERFAWPHVHSKGIRNITGNAMALRQAVTKFRPHMLHSFSRLAYLLPVIHGAWPILMSYQRHLNQRPIAWTSRLAGPRLQFSGCSEFIASIGRKYGGKWHSVFNCVDDKKYQPSYSVSDDAPLLFLSRIEEIKGADLAVDMALGSDRRLIIAGNIPDGENHRRYFERQIMPKIDGQQIEFIGPVDDEQKLKLLPSCAALVVPIQWDEPFGIVFAEALMCGTPVISSSRGALPEYIETGVNGFLVDSVAEGVRAIRDLGGLDRRLCRQRAVREFSTSAVAQQYLLIYRSMTGLEIGSSLAH